ncbi:Phosphoribosylformylglycinamidine synthase, partial [Thalictrum thalictroides]
MGEQFRRICKASGARVHIDTANARDSLYRASVDFVLNSCSSSASTSTIPQIDDEDPRQFLSGLANSIELQNIHATRIVSAAVAARTRSWFLQAWKLAMSLT